MGIGRLTGAWRFRVELNRKRLDGIMVAIRTPLILGA